MIKHEALQRFLNDHVIPMAQMRGHMEDAEGSSWILSFCVLCLERLPGGLLGCAQKREIAQLAEHVKTVILGLGVNLVMK